MSEKWDLRSLRVLNTRPEAQGHALNQAINDAGGQAIHYPTLIIEEIPTSAWLPDLLPLLHTQSESQLQTEKIQHAIFTSINAVHYFFDGLEKQKIHWPKPITVIAIGTTTANALKQRNITVHDTPTIADSEHLLSLPILQHVKNQRLLLVKGEGGRPLIPTTLTARGAQLFPINVYRRTFPKVDKNELSRLWQNDAIDIILFTSQQAMQNLFALFGERAEPWLQQKPCLVISPRLAETAAAMKIKNRIICQPDTIIAALHQFNQGRTHG